MRRKIAVSVPEEPVEQAEKAIALGRASSVRVHVTQEL
jgi:hypothetical protein